MHRVSWKDAWKTRIINNTLSTSIHGITDYTDDYVDNRSLTGGRFLDFPVAFYSFT